MKEVAYLDDNRAFDLYCANAFDAVVLSSCVFGADMAEPGRERQARGTVVIFFVFLLLGSLLSYKSGSTMMRYSRSSNWKPTPATITKLDMLYSGKRRGSLKKRKSCQLEYNYTVDGKLYYGNRVDAQMQEGTLELCSKLQNCTSVGGIVVYYNPKKPSESMISLNFSLPMFTLLAIVAVMFSTLGVSGLIDSISGKKPLDQFSLPAWYFLAIYSALYAGALLTISAGMMKRGYKMAILPLVVGGVLSLVALFATCMAILAQIHFSL